MSGRYFESILSLEDVDFKAKRVFIRDDFNVPLDASGKVADDFRIRAALPTIQYVLANGGKPIIASHLGRPKGRPVPGLSLKPVRDVLEPLLGAKVLLAPDCVGEEVRGMAAALAAGEVLLLENLRFHAEEEADDPGFSRELAALADVYVNDAFGTAHRAHASTDGVARLLRPAVAGFLLKKEIEFLGRLLGDPDRPFVAILGGAKISDKIGVLRNLLPRVDALLVGGGMANTFLKAGGFEIADSLFEAASLDAAREIAGAAESQGVPLLVPVDFIAASRVEEGAATVAIDRSGSVPKGFAIVDIGGVTISNFCREIGRARTIFWNGPPGVFEIESFARGTLAMARAVADATSAGAISVVGGGDTARAVAKAGVGDRMTHISTGGGASLEFVEGKELPGILALSRKGAVR
jgi:phosphoglycerate kinase